jgi:PEP-CTERM motif
VLDTANCSSGEGYGYGYGYGQSSCLTSTTRSGDPGEFLDTGDARIGFSSNAVTTDVPEPASLALLGIGLAGMGAARRRAKAA